MLHMMQAFVMATILVDTGFALSLTSVRPGKRVGQAQNLQASSLRRSLANVSETGLRQLLNYLKVMSKQEGVRRKYATKAAKGMAWNDMQMAPSVAPTLFSADDDKEWVNWTLCGMDFHSNLGGQGPDGGEESIRYYRVVKVKSGQTLDLVVTANTSYKAKNVSINGLVSMDSCFGVVNLKSKRSGYNSVDLLFTFYLTGTNTSVTLNKHFFTIYDFDSGPSNTTEHAQFCPMVSEYHYRPDHEMAIDGNAFSGMGLLFSSTQQGTGMDNPNDPMNLTVQQARRAVMTTYEGKVQWKVSLAVTGGKGGRNFVFAGYSNLVPDSPTTSTDPNRDPSTTTTTTTCYMQSCQVWADPHVSGFDNDDNQGPQYLALLTERAAAGMSFDRRPMDVNAYDAGDFWLVKSDPIYIQGRFRLSGEFIPDRAAVGAVAVGGPFLGPHKLIVEPLDGQVTFDGEALPDVENFFDASGQVSVRQVGDDTLEAIFPMNVKLMYRRLPKHVDVKITMPQIAGIDGECGNFDGIPENDGEPDVLERMGDVRIDDSMLLFEKNETDKQAEIEFGVHSRFSAA